MLVSPAAHLRRLADDSDADSLSRRLRERRFRLFDSLVARLEPPVSILDVGGTVGFWERRGWAGRTDVSITLLNLGEQERRALLARAAERTVTEGRPVSVSEVARELIRNSEREGKPAA